MALGRTWARQNRQQEIQDVEQFLRKRVCNPRPLCFTTYSEIWAKVPGTVGRNVLAAILGVISTDSHNAGRGMITVIVVHKARDISRALPGEGFFGLAQKLGIRWNGKREFFEQELTRVRQSYCGPRQSA